MSIESRFALLIGVNTYATPDLPGLLAPRNDVLAWFRLLRRLGVPARNIRVLTSPELTPGELDCDDAVCAPATTEAVNGAVTWMRGALDGAGADGVALLFHTGHGEAGGGDPAVFLADYAGGSPAGAPGVPAVDGLLRIPETQNRLGNGTPRASVTCIWDTCRKVDDPDQAGFLPLIPGGLLEIPTALGGHDAFERCFGGVWRGQFTWAALTVLEQWPHQMFWGTPYVAISYLTLISRVNVLLSAFTSLHREVTQAEFQDAVAVLLAKDFKRAATVPSDRLLAKLAEGLGVAAVPGQDQQVDAIGMAVDPACAFLLPFSARAPLCASAVAAPSHEFPVGTTEFRLTSSGTPLFGTVRATTSGHSYAMLGSYVSSSTTINWPGNFTATFTPSGQPLVGSGVVSLGCGAPAGGQSPPAAWLTAPSGTLVLWSSDGKVKLERSGATNAWHLWTATSGTPTPANVFSHQALQGVVASGAQLSFGTTAQSAPAGGAVWVWKDTLS